MKTLFSTLTGIIVVIILAAVVIGVIAWSRAPDIIAERISKKLKVPVEIGNMTLGWGKVGINNVTIGNPPKMILSKAFSCQSIDVEAPFIRYLDQRIVIDKIEVDNVYLGLEFDSAKGTDGNWTRIMANLKSTSGQGKTGKKKKNEQPAATGSERSVLIRRLILTNIDVDVLYRKEGGKVQRLKRIDRIELTNVSSEGGLPMDQVMNSVLGQMLKSVFEKENLKNMLQDLLQQQGPLQDYLGPFKGIFNTQAEEEVQSEQSA